VIKILTETNRGNLIKDIRDAVDFDYGSYSPNPKVLRFFEGHDRKNPQVLIDFLPANRNKFMSISHLIGPGSPNFQYHRYGYCQPESCVIRCYAGKHQNDRALNGRLLVEHFVEQIRTHILKNWDHLLFTMNATLEDSEPFPLKDDSFYDQIKGTMVYIYEISFFILTQFRWNDIPDDYSGETLVDAIGGINYPDEKREQYGIILENKALE